MEKTGIGFGFRFRSGFALLAFAALGACGGSAGGDDVAARSSAADAGVIQTKAVVGTRYSVHRIRDSARAASLQVNDAGQVAGTAESNGWGPDNALFFWSRETGLRDITELGIAPRIGSISSGGQIVGSIGDGAGESLPRGTPFVWSPDTGVVPLSLPQGVSTATAQYVSPSGVITGTAHATPGGGAMYWTTDGAAHLIFDFPEHEEALAIADGNRAGTVTGGRDGVMFTWNLDTGYRTIAPPEGALRSYARGIGEGGQVVGVTNSWETADRPFLWTQEGGLKLLPVPDWAKDKPMRGGVSRAGAVITDQTSNRKPYYWTEATGLLDIVGSAGVSGTAQAISPAGTVIGSFYDSSSRERAFVWSEAEGLRDLNDQIDASLGIHLDRALKISDSGYIVAVSGTTAWLLVKEEDGAGPAIHAQQLRAPTATNANTELSIAGSLTYTGSAPTVTATWSWGDGTPDETAPVAIDAGAASLAASHTYARAGDYRITLTVSDAAGLSSTAVHQLTVHTGPQVTGTGTYTTFRGDFSQDPDLSGTVQFNFDVLSDSGELKGHLGFELLGQNLRLDSTRFDQLDIPTAFRFVIAGRGTFNGIADCRYLITGNDIAKPGANSRYWDTLMVQVWSEKDELLYSNERSGDSQGSVIFTGDLNIVSR